MNILNHIPSKNISPYVVRFLEITNQASGHISHKMIPRAFPAFIFTSPEMDMVENRKDRSSNDYYPGNIYFGGLGNTPVQMLIQKKAHFIVALLHPYCAGIFFKEDGCFFTEELYCVSDIDKNYREFNEKLWDTANKHRIIALIEQFILSLIKKNILCPYSVHAVNLVNRAAGCISVKKLAYETFTSERNLLRKFKQHVGLSPKEYADMIRFNSFMKEVINGSDLYLDHVALNYDYYDLSHLHKDFIRFTETSPTKLLSQDQLVNKSLLF